MEKEIYRGVSTEFAPVPFLLYENRRFEITAFDNIEATFELYGTDMFSVALKGAGWLDEGYDPGDSDYLRGMGELSTVYAVGFEFEGEYAGFIANLDILQDVSGETQGQQAKLTVIYPWEIGAFKFKPELSLRWMSEKTVDYYYGVSPAEARPFRPAYSPGASWEMEAELLVQRRLFGNFSVVGMIEFGTFGSSITDSPLVERNYRVEGALGIAYTF